MPILTTAPCQVCFSPDGRWVLSASFDKSVKLWDGVKGAFVATFRAHVGPVYQVGGVGWRWGWKLGHDAFRSWSSVNTAGVGERDLKRHDGGVTLHDYGIAGPQGWSCVTDVEGLVVMVPQRKCLGRSAHCSQIVTQRERQPP